MRQSFEFLVLSYRRAGAGKNSQFLILKSQFPDVISELPGRIRNSEFGIRNYRRGEVDQLLKASCPRLSATTEDRVTNQKRKPGALECAQTGRAVLDDFGVVALW